MKSILKFVRKTVNTILSMTVLFLVFLIVVLPIGIMMKLFGRDRLRLKKRVVDTYWTPVSKEENSYEQQF